MGWHVRVFVRLLLRDIKRFLKNITGMGDLYSWERFHKDIRSKGCNLLQNINRFPNPVFVAGCQRSGTTVLARVIGQSEGMVSHWKIQDDELEGAMILSGLIDYRVDGRHCFQTTYLNECYTEYFDKDKDFKLIWVLRNPYSVVYSMHYNWGRFSFNELFDACGYPMMPEETQHRYKKLGKLGISRIERACYSYNGKVAQATELFEKLGSEKIMIIDYDDMVSNKHKILPSIYEFINLEYKENYCDKIHGRSVSKSDQLSVFERESIERISLPVYEKTKELLSSY